MKKHLHSTFLSFIFLLTLLGIGAGQAFAQTYTVTATAGAGNGIISPLGVTSYSAGSNSQLYVYTAFPGYHVGTVTIDNVEQGPLPSPFVFNNITSDHTINVTFPADQDAYTITAFSSPHGSYNVDFSNTVAAGQDFHIFAIPDPGYSVSAIVVDNNIQPTAPRDYTFSAVNDNHTYGAIFSQNIYTITSYPSEHGSYSVGRLTSVPGGDDFTIILTPDPGYHVSGLDVDNVITDYTLQQYTFSTVTDDHHFGAIFSPNIYTVTASAGPNGTVSNLGTNQYPGGSDLTIALLPDPGYQVATFTVDGNVNVGSTALFIFPTLVADHTFNATFKPIIYTITATAGSHGTISNAGTINVDGGSDQVYAITPALGYKISDVTVDGISQGAIAQYTFHTLTGSHTISASFLPDVSFTIKATSGANGTITPAGSSAIGYDNNATYSITPAAGYHVATLKVDGVSFTPATSFTFTNVIANHTIAATYALTSFTITASASTGGTISPTGTVNISPGGTKTYTIKPDAGFTIADVTLDGVSIGTVKSYQFTNVSANHLIIASFMPVTYVITSSAGANGSISPSGPVSLGYGGSQTYTFAPNDGFNLTRLTVDGKSVTIAPSYTFTNVIAAHTIAVTFDCPKPATPVLTGPASAVKQQTSLVYTVTNADAGNSFTWTVPGAATITSGQGTSSITVTWGKTAGNVSCIASSVCSSSAKTTYAVSLGTTVSKLSTEQTAVLTATEETNDIQLQVYPNPVQDRAKISFTLAEAAPCKISLTDITGRLLTMREINAVKGYNETSLDVSRFTGGVYYLTLGYGHEIKTVMLIRAQ